MPDADPASPSRPAEPASSSRPADRVPPSRPAEPAALLQPAGPAPHPLCRSDELAERGSALVFDVLHFREPARAFVLRFDGAPVAYLNRCVHVPTEMDWQEGKFLDADRDFIICSIHGAVYEPGSGRCAGGPCGRGALTALRVEERDGQVCWYPSRDTRPAGAAALPADRTGPSESTP